MTPKRVLDQRISNYPSSIWFEEVSREDFNEAVPLAIRPEQVPAATESGRQVFVDAFQTDDVKEVA